MTTLFISDLHLDAGRPEVTASFLRFLDEAAARADRLYILGDLFEAWLGDDDPEPHNREVIAALRRYTRDGREAFFTRGNRDFLAGRRFCRETGASMLEPETVIDLEGRRALVLHGDELCTDDEEYQRYRRVVRHPLFKIISDLAPLSVRRRVGGKLRSESQAKSPKKPDAITDVNQQSVEDALRRHGVDLMIHGHTHRPAVHRFELDGTSATRIVLGDWYTQGSVLEWKAGDFELQSIDFGGRGQADTPAEAVSQSSTSPTD